MDNRATAYPATAEQANESSGSLWRKKCEDAGASKDQHVGGRRLKERTALGSIDSNAADPSAPVAGCRHVTADGPAVPNDMELEQSNHDGNTSNMSDVVALSSEVSVASPHSLGPLEIGTESSELGGPIADMVIDDPTHVPEYADDIFEYLRATEMKNMPKAKYMRKQKDINHSMRSILADWLIEVAQEYKLDPQTLYIAISYIDRFLSEMSVQRTKLQLVGVTAMLLAAKYEEIYPPAVDEFVYITDNTYSREQILKMEHLILKVLDFDMCCVTPYAFLQRFVEIAGCDFVTKSLAMYLLESTLQDGERYLRHRPSLVAGAALCNALYAMKQPCWTPTLAHYTKLSVEDISECVQDVYYTFTNAATAPQQAVREKYSSHRYHTVSQIPPPLTPPLH
mmetsp:Transcript_17755/g.46337  ORF Transcript_17755/g.46337 Transcript_17755/m.46337 type:complete len:397 (-) Transcript_17755:418-1608(-)|eukprot:CAMPEP_0182916168 /NCGR_PEP_ID=MMETSP0105_2-20130417/778_1 /TAXON_ID=81532 ORGANISM="Acanthoeca-like sp., Strain 10tr" /NCGR_SAMPLE_ID=MMETSP0105_2 /ASSEMBLY_ACC=CAM_ASM_000205 /LENGTH=396 /DNA_ID=CAMNT_0025053097 /DNA_START=83 /DNA_END=1273 /DNA_ORIENTATION=-